MHEERRVSKSPTNFKCFNYVSKSFMPLINEN